MAENSNADKAISKERIKSKKSREYLLADNLNLTESQDLDSLLALCRSATPKQMNMIVAMVRSALESVE